VPVQVRPRVPNSEVMKTWIVATYKTKEVKRLERNLSNQEFDYYLPKITTRKINSNPKEEILFPGYIFVYTDFKNYLPLKYTLGIKNIIKFGNSISCISNEEIKSIQMAEEASKIDPVSSQIQIGQEAIIKEGSLKGSIVKICSLPSQERVNVFLDILGTLRKVNIPEKNLIF
tara:strand:+ start:169 stop:687 length:519 start_codon:yes stop_codon:yes gene_type:complete